MFETLIAIVVLGDLALLLDLGGRVLGTYVQTPLRGALQVVIVTTACFALLVPALLSVAFEPEDAPRGLWLAAGLGTVAILHYLFPLRFGIRRTTGDEPTQVEALIPKIRIRTETFASPLVPPAADGLECLVLSDFHCKTRRKLRLLQAMTDALKTAEPDCVLLLGDLGEQKDLLPGVLDALKNLPARHGIFLVRGNHDFEGGRGDFVEQLARERSIHILANRTATLADREISLTGLESPWSKTGNDAIQNDAFTIGLTHTPDNLVDFARAGVPLSFAGHTHGGKTRLPLLGTMLVPSRFGRFLDYGWFQKADSRMFITKGIGYFPGLFNRQGEVLKIRLVRTA